MKAELTTNEMFEYIVEDPFYSTIHEGMVRIDDNDNMWVNDEYQMTGLTDGMIEVLFMEWTKYQKFMDRIHEIKTNQF